MVINKLIRKQTKVLIITAILLVIIAIGSSFALFEASFQSETQSIGLGDLNVSFANKNGADLSNSDAINMDTVPMSDIDGMAATDNVYIFKLTNNGTLAYEYTVKLVDNTDDYGDRDLISHDYIRYHLSATTASTKTFGPNTLGEQEDDIIYTYIINPGETHTFRLKTWVADADLYELPNSVLNQEVHLNILIEGEAIEDRAPEYVLSFNPNGGSTPVEDKLIVFGEKYGELPTPTRGGYTFAGWYTEASGGTRVTANDIVAATANTTIFAHWTEGNKVYVTYLSHGGSSQATTNLVAKYDGYYNSGAAHSNAAYLWKSMTGAYDGTVFNGTWGDDYLTFDGTSTHVALGQINYTNNVTLETTFSVDSVKSSNQYVFSNIESGGYSIFVRSTGYIGAHFYIDGAYRRVDATNAINPGEVYHVAATYDGTDIKLYVNGVLDNTVNYSGTITNPQGDTKLSLGCNPSPTGSNHEGYFGGKIYNAAIYNTVLTASQIANDYGKQVTVTGTTGTLPSPSRVGYSFSGWYSAESGGSVVNSSTTVTSSTDYSIYARWTKTTNANQVSYGEFNLMEGKTLTPISGTTSSVSNGVYTVTTDANYEGYSIPQEILTEGKTYILTYKLTKTAGTLSNIGGHSAAGMQDFFTIDNANSTTTYYQPSSNITNNTSAHVIQYKFTYLPNATTTADKNIYIQPNRGVATSVTCTISDIGLYEVTSTKIVTYNSTYGTLPSPTKTNYTFNGWYTAVSGGSALTSSSTVSINNVHGIFGRWTANDLTAPTITVTVPNGTTYAKSKTATITVSDDHALAAGTYTIKWAWGTSAVTCSNMSSSTSITIGSNQTSFTASATINSETGQGKIYVCNTTAVPDAVGNTLAANTRVSADMYLDNTGPTGTVSATTSNSDVTITFTNVTDANVGVASTNQYQYLIQTSSTCPSSGYSSVSNSTVAVTGLTNGTKYVCARFVDSLGNVSSPVSKSVKVGITYNITLNKQSGSGGTGTIYERYNYGVYSDSNLSNQMTTSANAITVPTRTNYVFNGYYTSTNGGGTQMINANGYITSSFTSTYYSAAGTLYAYWVYKTYNITLNKQSGSGGTSTIYEKYNTGIYRNASLSEQMTTTTNAVSLPTRDGYAFMGYYTATDGGGTQLISSEGFITSSFTTTKFTADTILYAYWAPICSRKYYKNCPEVQLCYPDGETVIYSKSTSGNVNGRLGLVVTTNSIYLPAKKAYYIGESANSNYTELVVVLQNYCGGLRSTYTDGGKSHTTSTFNDGYTTRTLYGLNYYTPVTRASVGATTNCSSWGSCTTTQMTKWGNFMKSLGCESSDINNTNGFQLLHQNHATEAYKIAYNNEANSEAAYLAYIYKGCVSNVSSCSCSNPTGTSAPSGSSGGGSGGRDCYQCSVAGSYAVWYQWGAASGSSVQCQKLTSTSACTSFAIN